MTETYSRKRLIGYARVSTYGQTLDAQLEQRAAGCISRNIYREKVTGARRDRRAAPPHARPPRPRRRGNGHAHRPSCASAFDLFGIVKRIVDAKAQFRSIAEPWADTTTAHGRLMLTVLGGLAEFEREESAGCVYHRSCYFHNGGALIPRIWVKHLKNYTLDAIVINKSTLLSRPENAYTPVIHFHCPLFAN